MKPILRIVKHVRTLLTCILLFLLVQLSEAINVEGQIHVRNGSAEGATIHTIMDGFRLDVFKVGERGIYKIVLEQNHKYELIFSVTGNYPQKIEIETLIPNTLPKSATDFPTRLHDVNLYTEIEGINFTFVNKPVKRIYYNAELNDFISEQFIDDSQIESQLEKALFHSVILKKEKAFITNLTGFEIAEMKREYDRILKNASIVYGQNPDLVPFNTFSDSEKFLLNDNTSYFSIFI